MINQGETMTYETKPRPRSTCMAIEQAYIEAKKACLEALTTRTI
jgi:hypothetical protein